MEWFCWLLVRSCLVFLLTSKSEKRKVILSDSTIYRCDHMSLITIFTFPLISESATCYSPSHEIHRLRNRRAKHARAIEEDLPTLSQGNNISTETQNSSLESPVNEFSLSSSIPHGTHQNDGLRICVPESSQTITISTPTKIFKRGQNVRLTNEQGEEIGNGCIQLADGTWCGKNLKELGLCVVDVNDLKVDIRSNLPHPCATGKTFRKVERSLEKLTSLLK